MYKISEKVDFSADTNFSKTIKFSDEPEMAYSTVPNLLQNHQNQFLGNKLSYKFRVWIGRVINERVFQRIERSNGGDVIVNGSS